MDAAGSSPIPLFANPFAGRGTRKVQRVVGTFRTLGLAVELRFVPPQHLAQSVRETAEAGAPIIGVAGGDGSIQTAAGALLGRSSALLPIPTGTFNHFAQRMGICRPDDPARAVLAGQVVSVPVGSAGGRCFVNTALVGIYAQVVRRREKLRRWIGKLPAAGIAALPTFIEFPVLRVRLELDDSRQLERVTPLVWVSLGYGGFPASQRARTGPDAERLEVVIARPITRAPFAAFSARVIAAAFSSVRPPPSGPSYEVLHPRAFRLDSDRRVDLTLDGELARLDPPLCFEVRHSALRVLALARAQGIGMRVGAPPELACP